MSLSQVTSRAAWIATAGMLALAALSLLNVGLIEFGPRHDRAIQVDELYFAACAARGTATGQIPVAGCHDNKTPLIFAIHQLVQDRNAPYYNVQSVKVAAFGVVALVSALAGYLAFLLAGGLAAATTVAMLGQVFANDATLMALKTDTTGAVFLFIGLILLASRGAASRLGRIFAAGCALGLAILVKQTYAFAAPGVLAWLAVVALGRPKPRATTFLRQGLVFSVGVVSPFALCLLVFCEQGRHLDFLYSAMLYPSIHGSGGFYEPGRAFAWRLASVLTTLSDVPLPVVSFAAAGVATMGVSVVRRDGTGEAESPRLLVVSTALAMLAMLLLTPTFFSYHAIPAWSLMATAGGVAISDAWRTSMNSSARSAIGFAAALFMSAALVAANSWTDNGSLKGTTDEWSDADTVGDGSRGQYAYVIGTWPDFYVYNGLLPASDVLFPWALPGAPAHWGFTLPDPSSLRGRILATAQQRNLGKLMDDFRRTPPRWIVVVDEMARSPGSPRVSDVPGIDEYLLEHCRYARAMSDAGRRPAKLFECKTSGAQ